MESARRLYHVDSDWGHSVAGYVTDYLIFVVSFACLTIAAVLMRKSESREVRRMLTAFIVYAAFMGVAFGAGGGAHHLLNLYDHEPIGKTWGSRNSGWMYFWIFAVGLLPVGMLAGIATVFAVAAFPMWSQLLLYALGGAVGIGEAAIVVSENLSSSGVPSAYIALVAYLSGGLLAGVLAVRPACKGGRGLIMLGMVLALLGHLIVVFKPASCTMTGVDLEISGDDRECPYSEDFNHNAIFHVFVTCSVLLVFAGVVWAIRSTAPATSAV